jgi:small-conductance mechanosensitive channel
MKEFQTHIIYSLIILVGAFGLKFLVFKIINQMRANLQTQNLRAKMIKKVFQLILTLLVIILLLAVWGVKKEEIMLFISSILTIIGIAFVAQWSILSNITASIILFINHPIKIGDSISILDKEHEVTGTVKDIGIFFVTVKTAEKQLVSVPSSLFMQKIIAKNFKKESHLEEEI